MFITTQNELISLMPTARWDRPSQLFGYLEEEERVALEPLLGTSLYQHLCMEYERLKNQYDDITSSTIKPTMKAKRDAGLAHADITERLDFIHAGKPCMPSYSFLPEYSKDVSAEDMQTVRLIRICQQIEFYKMLSHKAGLLTVSFNEGGGMNMISADGYEPADEKRMERVVKDAYMSASRSVDSLLLFLEADAKSTKLFTELWQQADAYYLHKDLLFQTARVLNEYLDIKGERMVYVALVRDIRFCQNTYLKPRIGGKLLKAVIRYANEGEPTPNPSQDEGSSDTSPTNTSTDSSYDSSDGDAAYGEDKEQQAMVFDELLGMLRTALAFYVESRRTTITRTTLLSGSGTYATAGSQKDVKLARRDSMTDAQQAMAMVCAYIEENLDALGPAVVGTPIYNSVHARIEQEAKAAADAQSYICQHRKAALEQNSRKLFTGFPATHREPELRK